MTYRNEPLRRAVASLEHCVHCGRFGCNQAAHGNLAEFGKGMGLKADDAASMALCYVECHPQLDQGRIWTKEEKRVLQFEWIAKTYIALMHAGKLIVNKRSI